MALRCPPLNDFQMSLKSSLGVMRRYSRPLSTACVIFIFLAGCYMYAIPADNEYFNRQDTPLDFLRRSSIDMSLDLTAEILYSRRCISTKASNEINRQAVTSIKESLIVDPVRIRGSGSNEDASLPECVPLRLSTSKPYAPREKFPELIFGMATTYDRLSMLETIDSIEHWAAGRDSKLFVMVEDYTVRGPAEVLGLETRYRDRGVQANFIAPISDSTSTSQNHFLVLTQMVKNSGPETKWFGLLDDDTFFPHLKPLSTALGQLDHSVDMYVGTLSEDFGSVRIFGIMAYGGAGAYLSVTLAKKLGTLDQAIACLDEAPETWGDIVLRNCVYHHSRAKLTPLPGLYQHDILGDVSGFFESGVQPLNLHHWKSWYHVPVVQMAQASKFCGSCFLQRWMFGADSVLSNGYSIVVYHPDVLATIDLERTEHTWNNIYGDMSPEYDFTIGPLRDALSEGQKKSYMLVDAEISENGREMRQLYLFKANREAGELDEVVELIWTR